ncbi:hypothetical protein G6F35_014480 [Rhizopus arrhizus]|nr:hypothetical protein G6F35_014480 [Rhizopus arrhizus]
MMDTDILTINTDRKVAQGATGQVSHIPLLTRNRYALPIPRSLFRIDRHGFHRVPGFPQMQQQARDHRARPSFACFAVNHDHMAFIGRQPLPRVFTKVNQRTERRGLMIQKRIIGS